MLPTQYAGYAPLHQHELQADIAQLAGPLEKFVLPLLSARAIAMLRGACKALHRLLDHAPASALEPAFLKLLPADLLGLATSSTCLQQMLQQQHAALSALRAPSITHVHHHPTPLCVASDIKWSPAWPSDLLAIITYVNCNPDGSGVYLCGPRPRSPSSTLQLLAAHTLQELYQSPAHGTVCMSRGGWCASESKHVHVHTNHDKQSSCIILADTQQQSHVLCSVPYQKPYHVAIEDPNVHLRPMQDEAIIPGHDQTFVEVVHLPSLKLLYRVEAPHLAPESLHAFIRAGKPKLVASWFAWAPGGSFFAVAWSRRQPQCRLTMHGADGTLMGLLDVQASLTGPGAVQAVAMTDVEAQDLWQPEFSWSPASKHLLALPTGSGDVRAVVHLDGRLDILPIEEGESQPVGFSPCGRYLSWVVYASNPEDVDPDRFHDNSGITGYIWDVQRLQMVATWTEHDIKLDGHVQWAPLPGVCLLPGCMLLLLLEEQGSSGQQAPVFRRCDDINLCPLQPSKPWSPSGDVFVSYSLLPELPAEFNLLPQQQSDESAVPASHSDMCHVLWHTETGTRQAVCCKRAAVVSSISWQAHQLSWHPSPAAHLYAVPDAAGTVCFVDSRHHNCLQTWTPILPSAGLPSLVVAGGLRWSPDGTCLAVIGDGATRFLCFGPGK